MRIAIAFQCTICAWWNYPTLRDNMSGNFTILCGHCGHGHHRAVLDGRVTEDRHNHLAGGLEIIHVMCSACSQKPRQPGRVARLRERLFAGVK